jgi:hypothetical protein
MPNQKERLKSQNNQLVDAKSHQTYNKMSQSVLIMRPDEDIEANIV